MATLSLSQTGVRLRHVDMSENHPAALFQIERLPFGTDMASRLFRCRIRIATALDYAGEAQPASGGDFFDFIPLESHALLAAIGHVSGQNAAAATLLLPALRGFLRTRLSAGAGDLRGVIRDLNQTLCGASTDSFYATLFAAAFDPERRELHYVNAGHEPALLVRHGGNRVCRLESTGTVLGLTTRAAYGRRTIALEPGDVLAAFTDGLVETADPTGRSFGEPGVLQVLHENAGEPAHQLARCLVDASRSFGDRACPAMDRTALVVRFNDTLANGVLEHDAAEVAFAAA